MTVFSSASSDCDDRRSSSPGDVDKTTKKKSASIMSQSGGKVDSKVYIGNLGNDGDEAAISDAFKRYGRIKAVFIAKRPPGFAFVEFEDPRDAEDAVAEMDGRTLCGRRIRVEMSSGRSRWPGGRPPSYLLRKPAPRYVRSPPRETRYAGSRRDGFNGDYRRGGRSRSRSRTWTSRSRSRSPVRSYDDRRRRDPEVRSRDYDDRRRSRRTDDSPPRRAKDYKRHKRSRSGSSGPEVIDSEPPTEARNKRSPS